MVRDNFSQAATCSRDEYNFTFEIHRFLTYSRILLYDAKESDGG
jgi:hypothetical protein